jgi:hypothetical protein
MKHLFSIFGVAAGLTLAPFANASVTWSFGGNAGLVSQGSTYSNSLGSISVYSEQINNSTGDIVSTIYGAPNNPTLGTGSDALFQVNDSVNNDGVGIAPYNPVEGSGGSMSSQTGITDAVTTANYPYTNSSYGNVLELELGSNIAEGTTLSFLLQAGIGASTDQVEVFYADASSAQNVNASSMTYDLTTPKGAISTDGTTSQFTITKNTNGTEFIAIEADCHYLLLDTITGSAPALPAVPEPRFYGLLLAGFLGLAGMVYQKRRAAQANA